MGKKNYKTTSDDKRVYPIKVRLIKPNPANQDKVVYNPTKDEIIIPAQTIANKDISTPVRPSLSVLFEVLSKKYGDNN